MKMAGKNLTHGAVPPKRLSLWLGSLSVSIAAMLLMAATADASLSCNRCHTMPPTDSPVGIRDASTGGFKGNHEGHSGASANSCTPCHGPEVNSYIASHSMSQVSDKNSPIVKLTPKLHNYSTANGKARYSRGTFFNQTSVPPNPLGTCSNVNCHFEKVTPAWGSARFNSTTDCDKCHGAPPSGGTSGVAGSHAKHDLYFPGPTNCSKCHSNNTTFQHATSAGSRNLVISFAAAPNNGNGAYSGPLNDYLPSQTNTFGNCTATYCHSQGLTATGQFNAPIQTATWGGTLDCAGCHNSTPATGSHAQHVETTYGVPVPCYKCHSATVDSAKAISSTANHVNGFVTIAFNSTSTAINGRYSSHVTPYQKKPGSGTGNCDNVYCHSNAQNNGGTGITYSSPKWGNSTTGKCGTCHANGYHGGAQITSGSHKKHLDNGLGLATPDAKICGVCHYGTGFATPSCTQCHFGSNALTTSHVNGKIDISFVTQVGGTYNGTGKPGNGYSNSTCSNVACHFSTTTPVWGTAGTLGCFGCHSLAAILASGSHAKHISATATLTMYNYTANRSTPGEYNFGCSNCHPLASTTHMSGQISVTLTRKEAGVGGLRLKNLSTAYIGIRPNDYNSGIKGTTKQHVFCSAAYCHSNGNLSNLVYAITPDWYGGSFTGDRCANCHGNSPNSTIAGSKSHYNNKFLGYTSSAGGHQIGIHAMNIYSSPGGLAKAGTNGRSSHGNSATSTTISCNICHYATVTTARNDDNFVCKTCHFAGNTVGALAGNKASIADRSMHVNGRVDLVFNQISIKSKAQMRQASFASAPYSSAWKRNIGYKVAGSYDSAKTSLNTATMWNSSGKTCSNVACHNGQSVSWSDNNGATTCVSCHTAL